MTLTGKNYIAGNWSAKGNECFNAYSTSKNQKLETCFYEASIEEINNSVVSAQNASYSYAQKSNSDIANFLENIASEILALGDELINLCSIETALSKERLIGERERTINQLKMFADVVKNGSWKDVRIDTAIPNRLPTPKPDIRFTEIPLGPVAIFGVSNFPLAFSVAGGDTASALAAGCPVVFKANPAHPGTSELVAFAIDKAIEKSHMPKGVFSLLHGESYNVGLYLIKHSGIKAVGFTGSFKGGKALFDAANKRKEPIPVYAEMGSTNPVFILPGAIKKNKTLLADGLVNSINLGVGQFCTNPGLVFCIDSEENLKFIDEIKSKVSNISPEHMLTEQIKDNYKKRVDNLINKKNVDLIAKGINEQNQTQISSFIFKTNANDYTSNTELENEVFGPSSLMVVANYKEELYKAAKSLSGHLTATIIGNETELEEYSDLVEILQRKVGRLIFNGFPTGVEVCPSMNHGGPFPATSNARFTSVGTQAIKRFVRPISFQNFPQDKLPVELKNDNPLKIWRLINGKLTKENI